MFPYRYLRVLQQSQEQVAQEKREYQARQVVQQGRVHQQVRVVHVVQGLQEQHHVQVCQEYLGDRVGQLLYDSFRVLQVVRDDLVGQADRGGQVDL